jgi:hypothetical protein
MGWYLNTETTLFDLCWQVIQRITGQRLTDHGPQLSELSSTFFWIVGKS